MRLWVCASIFEDFVNSSIIAVIGAHQHDYTHKMLWQRIDCAIGVVFHQAGTEIAHIIPELSPLCLAPYISALKVRQT